jgi:hypothetical protein
MHLRRLGTALLRLNPRPRSFRRDPLSEKRAAAAVSNTFLGQVARESTVSLTVPVPESSISTPDLRRGAPAGCARLPGARDGCTKHGSAARPCPTREGRRVLPGARPATMILPRGLARAPQLHARHGPSPGLLPKRNFESTCPGSFESTHFQEWLCCPGGGSYRDDGGLLSLL